MSDAGARADIALLLPDLRIGGAEQVCIYLANAFVARGLRVDLVLMEAVGDLRALVDSRVRIVDLGARRLAGMARPLARYLRERPPTVVLANMWPLPVVAYIARMLARVDARIVAAEHTTWSGSPIYRRRFSRAQISASMRLLYPLLDGVIAVSDGVARDLARIAGMAKNRITTIYNPIVGGGRAGTIAPVLPPSWENGSHARVLAVGTLTPAKGFADLVSAVGEVRLRLDVRLLILGEGAERGNIEHRIQALGLGDVVSLPGYSTDPTAAYRLADVFVLSSSCEGFGNVIVEAMEHGTSVVSTDCESGPREIMRDGEFGRLVPVGDVAAMADAIHDALMHPHDEAALRLRARDFTVEKATDAYLDLLLPDGPRARPAIHRQECSIP